MMKGHICGSFDPLVDELISLSTASAKANLSYQVVESDPYYQYKKNHIGDSKGQKQATRGTS